MVNTRLGRWHPLFALSWPLRRLLLPTPAQGCASVVAAATADGVVSGEYYGIDRATRELQRLEPSPASRDPETARALWDATLRWAGVSLPPQK